MVTMRGEARRFLPRTIDTKHERCSVFIQRHRRDTVLSSFSPICDTIFVILLFLAHYYYNCLLYILLYVSVLHVLQLWTSARSFSCIRDTLF